MKLAVHRVTKAEDCIGLPVGEIEIGCRVPAGSESRL
jgi:hypothetical protein